MIHLDTNFLIQALVASSVAEQKLQHWLANGQDLGISTIAWSEFLCGPLNPKDQAFARLLLGIPEPFLESDARDAAWLFNATGRRSRTLADCQIAAVAIRRRTQLATGNTLDFKPFEKYGLTLV